VVTGQQERSALHDQPPAPRSPERWIGSDFVNAFTTSAAHHGDQGRQAHRRRPNGLK